MIRQSFPYSSVQFRSKPAVLALMVKDALDGRKRLSHDDLYDRLASWSADV